MSLGGNLIYGVIYTIRVKLIVDELTTSVTVQPEKKQRVWQAGMVIPDLG